MGDAIDSYTKRKAPNAYILFVAHFINDYKASHSDGHRRFRGGPTQSINDPLVREAWDSLPEAEKVMWKERAREEKQRLLTEFTSRVEQFVADQQQQSLINPNTTTTTSSTAEGGDNSANDGGNNTPSARPTDEQLSQDENKAAALQQQYMSSSSNYVSLRDQSSASNLKRFLRPQKKRKNLEESKYAPTYFEDVSSAKQFEEKRRRERECLTSIWSWRFGENKNGLRDETFFLVSSQSSGVGGDVHLPGTLAFLEFSIAEGIKREFVCTVSEGFADLAGRRQSANELVCSKRRSQRYVCQEIFGEWMRSTQRDLSSKTPVFYCLVDEYTEAFDCLSQIYAFKDGTSNRTFSPYLLAAVDDLIWCLLQFFNVSFVPASSGTDSGSTSSSDQQHPPPQEPSGHISHEMFALSRTISEHMVELTKGHACDYHRKLIMKGGIPYDESENGCGGIVGCDGGDAVGKRCPLAVVRACAGYAKKWMDNGFVDSDVLVPPAAATARVAEKGKRRQGSGKESATGVESMKSADVDRYSYLALSATGSVSTDRTLHSCQNEGTLGDRRSIASELGDVDSDESADIIELPPEPEMPAQFPGQPTEPREQESGDQNVITTDYDRDMRTCRSASVGPMSSSVASYTINAHEVRSAPGTIYAIPTEEYYDTAADKNGIDGGAVEACELRSSSYGSDRGSIAKAPSSAAAAAATELVSSVHEGKIGGFSGISVRAIGVGPSSAVGPMSPSSVCPQIWSERFFAMYEAQLRLPNGSRGLGRGLRLDGV